jgi:putative transposase
MKYAFILKSEVAFPVAAMCRVLGVSRSGFYDWKAEPISERAERDMTLRSRVRAAFETSRRTYGSPRIRAELKARGDVVSRKKVAKLMREEGLMARRKKRFRATTDSRHKSPIAPNLLERNFNENEPNSTWVTDVTCIWTREGWLFLAVMLDLFSRRAIGLAASSTNDHRLALDALRDAVVKRRPRAGLVHHSDRGSPYASFEYRRELERFGIVQSMSRKADCWDNAVAESFFSTLKTELVGNRIFETFDDAMSAITDYVENFYNPIRRHSHVGLLSPIEFELKNQVQLLAA